jgi:hypothetical protein
VPKRSMVNQIWQMRTTWIGLGLMLISVLFWMGANSLPALGRTHAASSLAKAGDGVAAILLHSQTVVLSPNSSTGLTVLVRDAAGRPVAGVAVDFSADFGTVAPATVTSDENGVAETTYTATSRHGQVVITADVNGVTDTAYVEIRSASPSEVSTNTVAPATNVNKRKPGEQATITVTVFDPSGKPIKGEPVTFFGSLGEVNPASGITDAAGKVATTFTAGNYNGKANIVALSGYGSGTIEVEVIGAPVENPTPTPTPTPTQLTTTQTSTPTPTPTSTATTTVTPTATPTTDQSRARGVYLPLVSSKDNTVDTAAVKPTPTAAGTPAPAESATDSGAMPDGGHRIYLPVIAH